MLCISEKVFTLWILLTRENRKEKATFCKDYVHCLRTIYIMLQVGTFKYLMITDNILVVHLEISAYSDYSGCKGNIKENMFWKGYIHLIQLIFYIFISENVRTLLTRENRNGHLL